MRTEKLESKEVEDRPVVTMASEIVAISAMDWIH